MSTPASSHVPETLFTQDVELLTSMLYDSVSVREGEAFTTRLQELRNAARSLRDGNMPGGRDGFGKRFHPLSLDECEALARTMTQLFHLLNAAEEQHRIRVLRKRDQEAISSEGSIVSACLELKKEGVSPDEMRTLLSRMLVMPVLTAHPTEARRSTVLDHLDTIAWLLAAHNDERAGQRERKDLRRQLEEAVLALGSTSELRFTPPTPLDEVRAGLQVFERTLIDVTPELYRLLEEGLEQAWPEETFSVGSYLRWGTWIGGDRDGNPYVTSEVTRSALERQRTVTLRAAMKDAGSLGRELSVNGHIVEPTKALLESLEADQKRLPEIAARARRAHDHEPWREKLWFMQARLDGALRREEGGYATSDDYLQDLSLLSSALKERGLSRLANGRLKDAQRRAEVFGFHTASMDLRQHSRVHETAVAELLEKGGVSGYAKMSEPERQKLLTGLIERTDFPMPDRKSLSPVAAETLETLSVVGRAKRDMGAAACERYVVSFTRTVSDLLEVSFLARSAGLGITELRPVPLLEQLEDLERAEETAKGLLEVKALKGALGGELEVMVGYSDSGKQVGYVPSSVALHRAQRQLAKLADESKMVLTIFHGRGGAVGRGGGPASRAIRAQPSIALRGRLRTTEQGETIAARYGRRDIARRDLEQMVSAVLLGSIGDQSRPKQPRDAQLERVGHGAKAALSAYKKLTENGDRLAAYVVQATPIREISEMRIGSRPAARSASPALEELRAIPWVFCWNQSRHGVPGWYGLGTALDALIEKEGIDAVRTLRQNWPFFRALLDNAQLALARADIDVAAQYAALAEPGVRELFDLIRDEHTRTVTRVLEAVEHDALLAEWPTLMQTVRRRNSDVDILSHLQIELLRRLKGASPESAPQLHRAIAATIHGIAAGLQTAG